MIFGNGRQKYRLHSTVNTREHPWKLSSDKCVVSTVTIFKTFMGDHAPDPPNLGMLLYAKISPLYETFHAICMPSNVAMSLRSLEMTSKHDMLFVSSKPPLSRHLKHFFCWEFFNLIFANWYPHTLQSIVKPSTIVIVIVIWCSPCLWWRCHSLC